MMLLALLLLALVPAITACSNIRGIGDPRTATGGLFLEVDATDAENLRAQLFRVLPDGRIEWGGGRDAMQGSTTWNATLTAEQIVELRTLLQDDGWLEGRPSGSGTPRGRFARVVVRGAHGTQTYSIRGESPAVERLLRLLDQLTRGRHDEFMQRIPTVQPRMDGS